MKAFFTTMLAMIFLSNSLFSIVPFKEEFNDNEGDSLTSPSLLMKNRCHHHHRRHHHDKTCCHGPQGPQGCQGPRGPQGPAGELSTATASFFINVNEETGPTIAPGANFPFVTSFFAPQRITYNPATGNFNFLQTGLYLVSYGAAISGDQGTAQFALFYNNNPTGGTLITGSEIFINNANPNNHHKSTIVIPISTTLQTLSLVNSGPDPIQLQNGLGTATQGAHISIVRVADLP